MSRLLPQGARWGMGGTLNVQERKGGEILMSSSEAKYSVGFLDVTSQYDVMFGSWPFAQNAQLLDIHLL